MDRLKVNFPKNHFVNLEDFTKWYDVEARKNLTGKIAQKKTMYGITKKLPRWDESQKQYCFKWCRENMAFPEKVILAYAYNSETFYSYYDTSKSKYVIALPTVFIFFTAYPPIAKAALQHEFGHILNGDCIRYLEPKYRAVSNIVYDVAINASINKTDIDDLYLVLIGSKIGCPYVPNVQYPKWNLPVNNKGWSYEIAMEAALQYEKSKPKPVKKKIKPQVGQVIKVGKDYSVVVSVDGNRIVAIPLTEEDALDIVRGGNE